MILLMFKSINRCYETGFRLKKVIEYSRVRHDHGYTCKCGWKGWGRCRCTRYEGKIKYTIMPSVAHLEHTIP